MCAAPMKILYHHRTSSLDGQAVHIAELVAALRQHGHDVIMVEPPATLKRKSTASSNTPGLLRRWLPKVAYEFLELAYNVPAYLRLRSAYLRHRPDVIYERHNLFLLAGALLSKRFGVPYLLEVNSPMHAERNAHGGLALAALARASERWVWRRADVVLPVTSVLAGMVEAEGVAPARVFVVPNGIDAERFARAVASHEAKTRLGLQDHVVLGFTGFVREWNALERVIDYIASPERSDCVLLVVGDGPARAALEAHAKALDVAARVRFTGAVGRERIVEHVCAFDIALQPAANSYASPLKLVEYMALGRAIVAPRQPNILEMITDGVNGVLFEPNNQASLFETLDRLIRAPELRERLGEAARRTISERGLTWRRNAQRVSELAAQLHERTKRAGRMQASHEGTYRS